jgi:D-alanine transaminase
VVISPPTEPLANLDGVVMPLSEARIPATDRGFLFGDGVYEVLRVYGGRPWLMDWHFERFERSLGAIRITGVDLGRLRQRMLDTLAASRLREATVYLQVTRGSAPRSHAFPASARPLEFLFVQEFRDPYVSARRDGVGVVLHPDLRWGRCDIKSVNLLANVLATQAAKEANCQEALLTLPDGRITEASHSSFFGVKDGALVTTCNSPAILPGVTRRWLLELARRTDVPVQERNLHREELATAEELFLAGTTIEVLPIVQADGRSVGAGQRGPITWRLQEAYQEALRQFVEA